MGLARKLVATTAAVLAVTACGAGVLVVEVLLARTGPSAPPVPAPPIDAAAGPSPATGAAVTSVVWLGDSTAAGEGVAQQADTLPEQTAALLGQPIRLTDLGHSGDTIAEVLHTQLPEVAAHQAGIVFISVGANDVTHLTGRATFRRDYTELLAGLPSSVHTVVLLGVPDMGAPPRLAQPLRAVAGWRGRLLDDDVVHLAARTPDAVYVPIAAEAGPPFRSHPAEYFARDHYHPNAAGYALWARAVVKTLSAARVPT